MFPGIYVAARQPPKHLLGYPGNCEFQASQCCSISVGCMASTAAQCIELIVMAACVCEGGSYRGYGTWPLMLLHARDRVPFDWTASTSSCAVTALHATTSRKFGGCQHGDYKREADPSGLILQLV
ncbi:unnamed protein product [Peniophora sp. CBMAI 1063]|nr:unnamed protein product [Peniophora sp. CBMAI 1063]